MARSSVRGALAVVAALGVAGSLVAPDARAWCRTTTDDLFVPTPAQPCADAGRPLYWASRCVGFNVQKAGSAAQGIDLATARGIVQTAFDRWSAVDCPADVSACVAGDRTGTHPSIVVKDAGPVDCNQAEYNQKSGNANLIVFHDTWTKSDPDVTLALTTVTFDRDTGEIYDADIEINSDPRFNKVTIADDKVVYDLGSILQHETGHFLGIAHTQPGNTTSSMYAQYRQGATFMRNPAVDDACAVCAAYDPRRRTICDATPRRGQALQCFGNDQPDAKKGCTCGIVGQDRGLAPVGLGLGGLAFALGLVRRARRRDRRA